MTDDTITRARAAVDAADVRTDAADAAIDAALAAFAALAGDADAGEVGE